MRINKMKDMNNMKQVMRLIESLQEANTPDLKIFKERLGNLVVEIESLIETMPNKGDTSSDSQKVNMLNKLREFEYTINGLELEDLIESTTPSNSNSYLIQADYSRGDIIDVLDFISNSGFDVNKLRAILFSYQPYLKNKQLKTGKKGTAIPRNTIVKVQRDLDSIIKFAKEKNSMAALFVDENGDFNELFSPDNIFQPQYYNVYKEQKIIAIYREGEHIVVDLNKKLKDIV